LSNEQDVTDDEDSLWPEGVEELIEEAHAEESRLAAPLYEKAASIGGSAVYLEAGERYEDDGNERKAIEYYRKAADGGCYIGFALAATVYYGQRNYSDEARCWKKFVDAYVRDGNSRKAEPCSLNSFRRPLRYFGGWYLHGRFLPDGTPVTEYAQAQIDAGEPLKEWKRYLDRGDLNDKLLLPIASELLAEMDQDSSFSGMVLGDTTALRNHLRSLLSEQPVPRAPLTNCEQPDVSNETFKSKQVGTDSFLVRLKKAIGYN